MLSIDMPKFVSIVKEHFNDDDIKIIMEVGSMDGKDSLFFKKSFPNADVYAIEGLPENYTKYMENLDGIKTFNTVIAEHDGEVKYHIKNINGIHGIYDRGQEYGVKSTILPCKRIDTFCKENGIEAIDMMKIDVEGATLDVLKSMGDILKTVKIMHVETETYPFFKGQRLHNAVLNFLEENGFRCVLMTFCQITASGKQSDSVWIRNS